MNPEDLQSLVASGRMSQAQVQKLQALAPGKYCHHKSWGFGKISAYDLVLDQVVIDFEKKKGHAMLLAYATESLTFIPAEHILAIKASEPEKLRTLATENPEEVIRIFSESFGENAYPDRMEAVLTPDIIPAADWKKWIASAKRACKKDGRIAWPLKKGQPFQLKEKPESEQENFRARIQETRTLDELLVIAEEILKKLSKSGDIKSMVPEVVQLLDNRIGLNEEKNPSVVIEAIWIRDDLSQFSEVPASAASVSQLIKEVHNLHTLIGDLSMHRQKHILPIIKDTFPDWEARIKAMVTKSGGRLLTEMIQFLADEGKDGDLKHLFERAIFEQRIGSEALLWLCKNRDLPRYSKWLPELINGRLLSVMMQHMENAALDAGTVMKKNPLTDQLLSDQTLIVDLVRACDAEETRDLGKALMMNPAVEELDKRSLMARLIKVSPSVQSLLVSNQMAQSDTMLVSWESLERRKQEYDDIINKKIPENSREIAVARSYGDLRENHEFKAAKEMQTVLMRQKAELEQMLTRARGTDFSDVDVSAVNIGTRVTFQFLDSNKQESMSILGAWDSDPEKGIISYQTAMASAMLGKKVGDEAVLPGEQGDRKVRILGIEAAVHAGVSHQAGE